MPYKNKEDKRANSRQKYYASLSKEEKSGEGKVESLCGKETKTGMSWEYKEQLSKQQLDTKVKMGC